MSSSRTRIIFLFEVLIVVLCLIYGTIGQKKPGITIAPVKPPITIAPVTGKPPITIGPVDGGDDDEGFATATGEGMN